MTDTKDVSDINIVVLENDSNEIKTDNINEEIKREEES
jgi:hypothetical protein